MQKNQPSLPVSRAFALQIYADVQVRKGQLKGRVEHMRSGEATHFESLKELRAFITHACEAAETERERMRQPS